MDLLEAARSFIPTRRRVRIGVTGLRRSGKTSLLTSLAVNLLANALPALTERLQGRPLTVALAASGAEDTPRFDPIEKSAALAEDPPHWPRPTDTVSLLALDLQIGHAGLAAILPPQKLRLEFVDYPGEWLMDLPLLKDSFQSWSATTLRRLEHRPEAHDFLAFVYGLPAQVAPDDQLIAAGHDLYVSCLQAMQQAGCALLQPGRFLMPAPGAASPWQSFFPHPGSGRLPRLLEMRFSAYQRAVRDSLAGPGFKGIDRLVVLADLLGALHAGQAAFEDTAEALCLVARALSHQSPLPLLPGWLQPWGLQRIAFAATKADHVAQRQRANLAALMAQLVPPPQGPSWRSFAIASICCTEDFIWALDSRPVSAVRGHVEGLGRVRSYPGEVPDRRPGALDWGHPFLELPDFSPKRLAPGGRGVIDQIGLDRLLSFLLEDML